MVAQKLRLNHSTIATLVKIISIIILVDGIIIYPMEQATETQLSSNEDLPEHDLPQVLAWHYITDWVAPYNNNQKYIAGKYKDLVEKYRRYESILATVPLEPIASVMGGLNYSMTLDEMEQTLENKILQMKQNNLLVSRDAFEQIKDNYFDLPHKDLTRIWGAEYLKEKINKSPYLIKKYNVPDYIIVLDNSHYIKINLSFFTRLFPLPLELLNGSLYFKKVSGQPCATPTNLLMRKDIGIESGIGFDDFSKPGNIIQDAETALYYIIDTEFRSFKFPISSELESLLNYAAERFIYLNDDIIEHDYECKL